MPARTRALTILDPPSPPPLRPPCRKLLTVGVGSREFTEYLACRWLRSVTPYVSHPPRVQKPFCLHPYALASWYPSVPVIHVMCVLPLRTLSSTSFVGAHVPGVSGCRCKWWRSRSKGWVGPPLAAPSSSPSTPASCSPFVACAPSTVSTCRPCPSGTYCLHLRMCRCSSMFFLPYTKVSFHELHKSTGYP